MADKRKPYVDRDEDCKRKKQGLLLHDVLFRGKAAPSSHAEGERSLHEKNEWEIAGRAADGDVIPRCKTPEQMRHPRKIFLENEMRNRAVQKAVEASAVVDAGESANDGVAGPATVQTLHTDDLKKGMRVGKELSTKMEQDTSNKEVVEASAETGNEQAPEDDTNAIPGANGNEDGEESVIFICVVPRRVTFAEDSSRNEDCAATDEAPSGTGSSTTAEAPARDGSTVNAGVFSANDDEDDDSVVFVGVVPEMPPFGSLTASKYADGESDDSCGYRVRLEDSDEDGAGTSGT